MGSFIGHAIPGTFFIMMGIWQLIHLFSMMLKKTPHHDSLNRVSFSIQSKCCKKRKPLEAIVKIIACCIGMAIESLGFFLVRPGRYQHFTMYASFGFCGVLDLLLYNNVKLPEKLDFILHGLAFVMEGLMFQFHLHGRGLVDQVIHTLIVYSCYFSSFAMFATALANEQLLLLLRVVVSISILVQGTWFWQAGAIIYPWFDKFKWELGNAHNVSTRYIHGDHKMNEAVHHNIAIVVMLFCWHIILNFIFTLILFFIIKRIINRNQRNIITKNEQYKTLTTDEIDMDEQSTIFINSEKLIEDV